MHDKYQYKYQYMYPHRYQLVARLRFSGIVWSCRTQHLVMVTILVVPLMLLLLLLVLRLHNYSEI